MTGEATMYDVLKILLDRLMEQERRLEAEWQMRIFTEQSKCSSNSAADVVALIECVAAPSKKIDAIKLYGKITGIGLKESKDAIERITHQFTDQQAVFDGKNQN